MAHGDWAWVFVCEYVVRMAWRKIVNGKERERDCAKMLGTHGSQYRAHLSTLIRIGLIL